MDSPVDAVAACEYSLIFVGDVEMWRWGRVMEADGWMDVVSGNGYHHSMPEHHRSRGHGSRSRYGGGHGMHYSGIGGRQMVDPLYSYGHGY